MGERAPVGLLWARLFAAVGLVGIVVGVTAVTFRRDGLDPATGWFQLMQGVGGVALGWLFTSQGMDAALLRAAEEARGAERARVEGSDLEKQLAIVQRDARKMRVLLEAALSDPAVRSKVEDMAKSMEGGIS
jgi:hypothetical protein